MMINPAILDHKALAELTGYQRAADIENWLTSHGIPCFRAKNGIWTTVDAANAALGVAKLPRERQRIEF